MMSSLRNYVKQILIEAKSVSQSDMGFLEKGILTIDPNTQGVLSGKLGVVYNAKQLNTALQNLSFDPAKHGKLLPDLLNDAMIGMIVIAPPKNPCNGAWEVRLTAGPGQGKIVYAMGYKMSPSGKLIADRKSLSRPAQNAWKQVVKKSSGEPLDDVSNPKNNDPNDDCNIWPHNSNINPNAKAFNPPGMGDKSAADAVNRSYDDTTGGADWKTMSANFAKTLFLTKMKREELGLKFEDAASFLFGEHYI